MLSFNILKGRGWRDISFLSSLLHEALVKGGKSQWGIRS
jgi:hypothetical protein